MHARGHDRPSSRWVGVILLLGGGLSEGCRRAEQSGPEVFKDVAFRDQDARPVEAQSFAGEVLLLNFIFTSCPGVCPNLTRRLVEVRGHLAPEVRGRARFLSVSVDPDNDTSKALKSFAQRWRADVPHWSFVRVEPEALKVLAERLVVFEPGVERSPAAHNLNFYLFDRQGRLVQRYSGTSVDPRQLAHEINTLDALDARRAQEPSLLEPSLLTQTRAERIHELR